MTVRKAATWTTIALALSLALFLCACNFTNPFTPAAPQKQEQSESASSQETPQPQDATQEAEEPSTENPRSGDGSVEKVASPPVTSADMPAYTGSPFDVVNGNNTFFTEEDRVLDPLESYSPLDSLGRCGSAFALIGPETLPTMERGSIAEIKPVGWQNNLYDFIDGGYLYNRCHLVGYQLTSENANANNLITGTRYLNVQGMEPFEFLVRNYVTDTQNHVLYRATPLFTGNNLVADGVLIEAESIEDSGEGISFCVWCFNVQPGVIIDYATGANESDGTVTTESTIDVTQFDYIININSGKFHYPNCESVATISEKNMRGYNGTREELIDLGFEPCGSCKP